MIDTDEIKKRYQIVNKLGFRVKLCCIKCNALIDVDNIDTVSRHHSICELSHKIIKEYEKSTNKI